MEILCKNRDTEYGRVHNFSSIRSVEQFQQQVPLITYDDIEPYVRQIKNGEQNILTSLPVVYFSATSGSSGDRKFIPVTKERITALRCELIIRGLYAPIVFRGHWTSIFGDILYLCGSYLEGYTDGGIPYGGISGYLVHKGPKTVKKHLAVPPKVFTEPDFNTRMHEIAYYALLSDIKHMGFTSTIEALLLFDYIEEHRDELLERIQKSHPRRAKYLKQIDIFQPDKIWKNIKMVNSFLTKTNKYYLKSLEHRIGRKLHMRDAGINASEGRMTIGICKDDISGYPAAYNVFFEFLDPSAPDSLPKTLDQIEVGKRYEIVLTTYEGLYRYKTGDIIEVTSRKKNIPLIRFYERNKFISLVGEQVSERDLVISMQEILEKHKIDAAGFTYLPCYSDPERPRYEILLEIHPASQHTVEMDKFLLDLDEHLKHTNHGYYRTRENIRKLGSPVLSLVTPGSWEEFNKKRVVTTGQPKHIHLYDDPSFRENFIIKKSYS